MANLKPQPTTDRFAADLLDEEDERERVLLVVVRGRVAGDRDGDRDGDRNGDRDGDSHRNNPVQSSVATTYALNVGTVRRSGDRDGDSHRNNPVQSSAATTYALNVGTVREVIRARNVTRVPGTPRFMRGLVNVRGMVVTVLDLAECLDESRNAPASSVNRPIADTVTENRAQMPGSIVLLEHGGRLVGLAVDAVRDVRPVDDAGLIDNKSVLAEGTGVKRGLTSAGGEVVTLLDVAALLARHLISSGET